MSLETTLYDVFSRSGHNISYRTGSSTRDIYSKYIQIDLDRDVFEIPVFLYKYLSENCTAEHTSSMCAFLYSDKRARDFATAPPIISDFINSSFTEDRLLKVDIPEKNLLYYGTCGALFDKHFNPLFICSWKVKKQDGFYVRVKPVVRYSRSIFTDKPDFITSPFKNRIFNFFLKDNDMWHCLGCPENISVIIDDFPWSFHAVDTPSVSDTQDSLIKAALDNLGVFMP